MNVPPARLLNESVMIPENEFDPTVCSTEKTPELLNVPPAKLNGRLEV